MSDLAQNWKDVTPEGLYWNAVEDLPSLQGLETPLQPLLLSIADSACAELKRSKTKKVIACRGQHSYVTYEMDTVTLLHDLMVAVAREMILSAADGNQAASLRSDWRLSFADVDRFARKHLDDTTRVSATCCRA